MKNYKYLFLSIFVLILATKGPIVPFSTKSENLAPLTNVEGRKQAQFKKKIKLKDLINYPERYFDFSPFLNEETNGDLSKVALHYKSISYHLYSNWSWGSLEAEIDVLMDRPDGHIIAIRKPEFRKSILNWLFFDLSRTLDYLLINDPLFHPNREGQIRFGERAKPIIQKWIDQNSLKLKQILPLVINYPNGLNEYSRNPAIEAERFGLYAHVWSAQGATDWHNHAGNLVFIIPLANGFEQETLNTSAPLKKPWHNKVISFDQKEKQLLPPGQANYLTRGKNAIHIIRNTGEEPGIMLEFYVWDKPFNSVNNPIPVEGSENDYYVLHVPTEDILLKISDRLRKIVMQEVSIQEVLPVLKDPAIYPIFTTGNTAILNKEQAEDYLSTHSPLVWKLENGSYLFGKPKYSKRFLDLFEEGDQGLNEDAQRNKEAMAPHIQKSRENILKAAAQVSNKEKVLILGVGNGTEIPIAELAEMFQEVTLVGLSLKTLKKAKNKAPPEHRHKIKSVIRDISNDFVAHFFEEVAKLAEETNSFGELQEGIDLLLAKTKATPYILKEEGFDFVISSMVADQLSSILFKELRKIIYSDEPYFQDKPLPFSTDALSTNLVLKHLKSIQKNLKRGGVAFLSSSVQLYRTSYNATAEIVYTPYQRTILPLDALTDDFFRSSKTSDWKWHFSPLPSSRDSLGEDRAPFGQAYQVEAYTLSHKPLPYEPAVSQAEIDNSI